MPELLQSKDVQDELKEVPFTPQREVGWKKRPIREIVRIRLCKAQIIPKKELDYMKEHPEDMEWLERKVKPRFWSQFLAQLNSHYQAKEEEKAYQSLHVTTTICKLIIVDDTSRDSSSSAHSGKSVSRGRTRRPQPKCEECGGTDIYFFRKTCGDCRGARMNPAYPELACGECGGRGSVRDRRVNCGCRR
ncbi:hypothetical protein BDV30DRAFT_55589 [Aspergillus minisclerotigenes]|uniref:Uncharacterized protein n=1 Tax=Aspergillus minisclerotigenes TaxID=656917 RepID=A0A5N6IKT1_9EURO|nr:hypothetical protein BDV30DRAFT_55589 [Aspergillus minisclerotigenes]